MASPIGIDLVAGARPNFMKIAPILRAISRSGGPLQARLVHTGQHYDAEMSDVFFEQLSIPPPDVHLGVGSGSQGEQTANILAAYEKQLLTAAKPSGVVVVGDVNSTMAATLAAVKLGIPVAHVEAGLRSFDRSMPEEINRIVTDVLAQVLLVSEPSGNDNLKKEGIASERVFYVGNVMIDTLVHELAEARALDRPRALGLADRAYVYVTLHRPSNVDSFERLERIVDLFEELARQLVVVFPVHPRTRRRLAEFGLLGRLEQLSRLQLLAPQGYRESLSLLASARAVLTDSGGIQEESSFLGVPCLTLRPNTERPATVSLGTSTVIGDELDRVMPLLAEIQRGGYKTGKPIPGWDGHAAQRIVDVLARVWASD